MTVDPELDPETAFDARRALPFLAPLLIFLTSTVLRIGAVRTVVIFVPTLLVGSTLYMIPRRRRRDGSLVWSLVLLTLLTGVVMFVVVHVLGIGEG